MYENLFKIKTKTTTKFEIILNLQDLRFLLNYFTPLVYCK